MTEPRDREPPAGRGAASVLILLIGPKGCGKSHVGRLLEARLGVFFLPVEPLWLAYHDDCRAAGRPPQIAEGIARVHPAIERALEQHAAVCVETTGAAAEILDALRALRPRWQTLLVRVCAPLDLCRARIAARDPAGQIPTDEDSVRRVHAASEALALDWDLVIDGERSTDAEVAALLAAALAGSLPDMQPRQVVRAWVDAFNRADADALAAFYREDAVNHQVAESPVRGRKAIRAMFAAGFAAAEMVCIVENIFQEGAWAILEWRDPLGLRGCGFFRVIGGKIAFQRGYWDKLTFLRIHGLPLPGPS